MFNVGEMSSVLGGKLSGVVNNRRVATPKGSVLCPGWFQVASEVAKVMTASVMGLGTLGEQRRRL